MSHTKEPWIIGACLNAEGKKIGNELTDTLGRRIVDDISSDFTDEERGQHITRITLCVNALAGIENPEALPELLEWVEQSLPYVGASGLVPRKLRECFAKLKGGA